MSVKVAINGFGRIGRLAFRQMFRAPGYEVVAINDLTNPAMLAHLLKYDSTQGRYELCDKVEATENSIIVDGTEIQIYKNPDPEQLPWKELGVDVVLECTGFFVKKEELEKHIKAGAKKVVLSAPAKITNLLVALVNQGAQGNSADKEFEQIRAIVEPIITDLG